MADLKDKFCDHPFRSISTLTDRRSKEFSPRIYPCICPALLPFPIDASQRSFDEIWNGPEYQEVRASIHDGTFRFCNKSLCGDIVKGTLPDRKDVTDPVLREIIENKSTVIQSGPQTIILAHERACNIACPSCREEIITTRNDQRIKMDEFVDRAIRPAFGDPKLTLVVSGDGDPIASKHYRKLLRDIDHKKHKGVRVTLHTNALLLTLEEFEQIGAVVDNICVSIDAATRETYEDVRRPGKWRDLTAAMDFVSQLRSTTAIQWLSINFVVQKKNYLEMPAFVELGNRWNADRVIFTKYIPLLLPGVEDADYDFYDENCVHSPQHPEHQKFLEVLAHPSISDSRVDTYNLR